MSENKATHPQSGGHRQTARQVMRACGKASLATAMADGGAPYASMVTVAFDLDGSPVLLLSRLADHTRNLLADLRAALLFDGTDGYANPQEGPRVTVLGTIAASGETRLRRRFLARHPAATLYAGFSDFAVCRLTVERCHFVGGFARAVWLGDHFLVGSTACRGIGDAEEDILEHMNRDHADALDLYANRLLAQQGDGWRMTGIDPDGCDLRRDAAYARLAFAGPVANPQAARATLAELARQARNMPA